ncbi:hypothetical protein ACIRRA_42960 [Nocardia sp. NPDC101769]|uniref:hypothetical protein n=1 Tax=Nocardia sp. NPDC101769 TaxID=3364333 RepID=UPI00382BDB11
MSDQPNYPTSAAEAEEFAKSLTFREVLDPSVLPPVGTPATVSMTVRVPIEVHQAILDEAEAREVDKSTVVRDWLAIAMASSIRGDSTPISREDVQRAFLTALASVHPLPKRTA